MKTRRHNARLIDPIDRFERAKPNAEGEKGPQGQPSQSQITVVVVDDHPVVRKGLSTILNSPEIRVVAEAADGDEACAVYNKFLPDVLLLDLRLPKKDGLQVLHELASQQGLPPRVIMMTSYDSQEDICRALRAGAKAFLVKVSPPEQIRETIRRVAKGETFFPPEIGSKLVESMSQPMLSNREIQVLNNLAQGGSNKEIGRALYLSEGAIKYHVKSILKKLDAVGRADAIAIAARRGMIHLA